MSEVRGADLVDAITEWVDRADEDLDEHDIDAILRIQLAIDASHWSGVDVAELTQGDVASLKHHLRDVDAPEFTAWVVNETLRDADVVPPRGPARKAPSSRRRTSSKKGSKKAASPKAGSTAPVADQSEADQPGADEPGAEVDAETIEHEGTNADAEDAELEDPDLEDPDPEDPDLDGTDLDDVDDLFVADDEDGEAEDPEPEDTELDDADDLFVADDDAAEDGDISDDPEPDDAEAAVEAPDSEDLDDLDLRDADASAELGGIFSTTADADEEAPKPSGGAFAAAASSGPGGGIFAQASSPVGGALDESGTDLDRSAGFFAELDRDTTASVTGPAPVELRDAPDALGPAFLPSSGEPEARFRRIGVIALAAVALVAFVFAGIQLVNNVNQPEDEDVAVDADDSADVSDTGDDDASASAADDRDATESDDGDQEPADDRDDANNEDDDELTPEEAAAVLLATPEPTPEADLPPAEKTAIVLTEDGDIWSIDLFLDAFGEPVLIHDSSEHDGATDVSLVSAGFGIVDEDGDAYITSRTDTSERVRVWRSDRLGDARMIVEGSEQYAVLDTAGSVSVFDANRAATRISADKVWDASAGGTPPARDIDSYIDLVAFAVGDGDVQLIQTSADDNPVFQIWDGDTQPRAFNVDINEEGLFMGVGAGAVARYQWFEDGPPLSAVWDPLAGTRLPAISYATLEDRTAVVLNNGSVAAIDESGTGPILWDAEVSDLRAISITTLDDEVLLLLEGGTVLRVASDGETQNRGSIWDVTDESTSPAIKVLLTNP